MTFPNQEHDDIREIYMKDDPVMKAKNSERAIPKLVGSIGAIAFTVGLIILALSNEMSMYALGLSGIGLLMLIIFIAVDFKAIKAFFTARSTVYSANLMITVITLLGILTVINAFAANHYVTFDLTESKSYTLSPHSRNILEQINTANRPLEITVFLRNDDARRFDAKLLLEQYAHFAPGMTYKFVDYEISKKIASEFGVDKPSMMIQSDGRKFVYDFNEAALTGGIISLVNPEKKIVGILTGHGELSTTSQTGKSISEFAQRLENENYIVKTLNIGADGIPDEVELLVIAGPRDAFEEKEINAMKGYMDAGGAVFLFLEPFQNAGLDTFLADLGIENKQDSIIDQGSNYFNEQETPYITAMLTHPITLSFLSDTMEGERVEGLVLPTSTSLKINENLPGNLKVERLALTSDKSWGETSSEKIEINEDDTRGPIPVIVAGSKLSETVNADETVDDSAVDENSDEEPEASGEDQESTDEEDVEKTEIPKIESRFVIAGDSDMIANGNLDLGNNYNLVLNAVNWLTEDEEMMGERQDIASDRKISLSASQTKAVQIVNVLMPLMVAGLGVFMWLRRR